jgi:hypothetical protein
MLTIEAVQDQILEYLNSASTLPELEEWLVSHSWDKGDMPREVSDLVYEVELLLAESSSGHLDESELRDALRRACSITKYFFSLGTQELASALLSTGTNNSVIQSPIQLASACTRLSSVPS